MPFSKRPSFKIGWVERLSPAGLRPERTTSGAKISVNSSGTTSVDHDALSGIALRRFQELRPATEQAKKRTG
jgi:hypothetical protein